MKIYSYRQKNEGIITNLPSSSVTWATGRNVRMKPGCVYKTPGKSLINTNPEPIKDVFVFRGHDNIRRAIVCCVSKVYSYTDDFGTVQDITPSSITGTTIWSFGLSGGMPVLSNGNAVWKWSNFNTVLTQISGITCNYLHGHENRVFFGGVTEGGYSFPARGRWGSIANVSGITKDLKGSSGGKDFINPNTSGESLDRVIGSNSRGKRLIVFAEKNIWYGDATPEAVDYVWTSTEVEDGLAGARLQTKSAAGIYFLGKDDIYMIGNEGIQPIGFNIRNLLQDINWDEIDTGFAHYNKLTKEVFFCVPTGSNTVPDTSFIYNEETKGWQIGDCDYSGFAVWEGSTSYGVSVDSSGRIGKFDDGFNNIDGSAIEGYIETGDMDLRYSSLNKIIDAVIPMLKSQDTQCALMIQIGTRDSLNKDIEWSSVQPYSIGVSSHVNFRKMGKYARVRFITSIEDSPWELEGFDLNFFVAGSR